MESVGGGGGGGRSPAIGIDLGTTYSCVAFCQETGKVVIIKNEIGVNTTPSHVGFSDPSTTSPAQIIVGDAAKQQSTVLPGNTVYDVKRLIGRKFNDPVVQEDIKLWPFTVIDDENSPRIQVNGRAYNPEQISAKLLSYLKKQAEIHLGCPVKDAVITVPAYFNDGQRQATKDAGSIAGLNVLRIINEPTAAAIAYNHQLQRQTLGTAGLQKKNVLIFDLGGGTFDLALLTMEGSSIVVKAVDGDTHLGGQDFDNKLVDYCIQEFKKKHNIDLSQCQPNAANEATEKFNVSKRLRRLKNECEMKKIYLSSALIANVSLEVIFKDLDLNLRIERKLFEEINKSSFNRCIEIVDRILTTAEMSKDEVDDVVLVGGSSRIPKIQAMIQEYFEREPCRNIKQDEAVAYGAAVEARQMASENIPEGATPPDFNLPKVVFKDVIPHSLGVQINVEEGDVNDFSAILKKNTTVPCKGKETYFTGYRGQKEALISIYEGQSPTVAGNELLGEFVVDNLPPDSPRGERVDIHMEINDEGILEVTAECPANSATNNLTVSALNGRLKREEVEQLRVEELNFYSTTSISVLEPFTQD